MGARRDFFQGGARVSGHGECNGGLERSRQPSPAAEPLVKGSGAKPHKAESFEAFVRLKEGLKLCCQYAKAV